VSIFEGVSAAAVTPRRTDSYEANLAGFLEVIDFLSASPVDGIVVLGTTGEMLHFDVPERVKILEFSLKRTKKPIIAGVTHSTLEGTVELAQHAVECGCAGLAVMPPYYFLYQQPEIDAFYREFARRVGLTVPILLYNIPVFTNLVETDTICRLIEEGVVAGIKDSSGDRERIDTLLQLRERKPFHLLVGDDKLLFHALPNPGVGSISGVASALPELLAALLRAIRESEDDRARQLNQRLMEFCDWYDEFPNCVGVKEALATRMRIPIPPATPLSFERQQKLEEFRAWFNGWLPDTLQLCQW
jgi:dihydrodipicolinate synthase/N-acetylneuraminate lyase